jgi:UDP-N-acetylmuramyl pentapeptide synthase
MSNPGEIVLLSRLTCPHVAMITTVGPAHLQAFDDINGIAREKPRSSTAGIGRRCGAERRHGNQ